MTHFPNGQKYVPCCLCSAELGYLEPAIRCLSGSRLHLRSSDGGAISSDLEKATAIDPSPPTEAFLRPMRRNQQHAVVLSNPCVHRIGLGVDSLALHKLDTVGTKRPGSLDKAWSRPRLCCCLCRRAHQRRLRRASGEKCARV
jgi:hypothetical protein